MTKQDKQSRSGFKVLWGWTPVLVSLFIFIQFLTNGYLPAREKSHQLDGSEAEMTIRMNELLSVKGGLETEKRMLEDGIYRERVRRTLCDPRQATLTLQRARALDRTDRSSPR